MSDDDSPSGAGPDGYDALADRAADRSGAECSDGWESPWGDNPLQEHHSWPVTRRLLPAVEDCRVLDAGCGVGDHVEWLREEGATVVGVDASERAVEVARERFGDRATFRHGDLSEPLAFASDGEFDLILSHLVLDHVADLGPAFEEFHRVLADDGALVFTVVHPMQYYLGYEAVTTYYGQTPVELGWESPVTSYQRPLAEILGPLADAEFRLDTIEEPRPDDEYAERANDEWNVEERPQILSVRARPRSAETTTDDT